MMHVRTAYTIQSCAFVTNRQESQHPHWYIPGILPMGRLLIGLYFDLRGFPRKHYVFLT